MDTTNTYNKLSEPKVVDTVSFHGKYVDAKAFKSKVIKASATSAFIAAAVAFFMLFLS